MAIKSKTELEEQLKVSLQEIENKLASLGSNDSAKFNPAVTNFKMNELDGNTVNISTCVEPIYLLKALSLMRRVKEDYDNTTKELGLTTYPPCMWFGAPVESWIYNLTIRVRIVLNQSVITQLNAAKLELQQYLSTEDRLKNSLEKIKNLVGKSLPPSKSK